MYQALCELLGWGGGLTRLTRPLGSEPRTSLSVLPSTKRSQAPSFHVNAALTEENSAKVLGAHRLKRRPLSTHLCDPAGTYIWWSNTLLEIELSLCGFSSFSSQAIIPSPGFMHLSHLQQLMSLGFCPKRYIHLF